MTAPSTSIIIPVFNDATGLRACLSGIAREDSPMDQVEVVVVDNGSNPPVEQPLDLRIPVRVVRCATPGSYAARNAGARAATGDVFAFIDADCVPDSEWLRHGVGCLVAGDGRWFVGGEVIFREPERRTAVALYQMIAGFGQATNIGDKRFTATANLLCTAKQFEQVGPFDERLLSGGDREWCWRAAKKGLALRFAGNACVYTRPRSRLASAIRQARRVAAGRRMLQSMGLTHGGTQKLARQRSPWEATAFIFRQRQLGLFDRFRVFTVAVVLRIAYALERLRLSSGGVPERR